MIQWCAFIHVNMNTELTIYFTIYCFVTFFVIFSNAIILILLINEHQKQKRSHKFITSMIISDLCSGIICISFGFVLFYPRLQQDYVEFCFGNIVFTCIFRYNSLLIKLTTAIDRYWAVVHPFNYYIHATDNKIKGIRNRKFDGFKKKLKYFFQVWFAVPGHFR